MPNVFKDRQTRKETIRLFAVILSVLVMFVIVLILGEKVTAPSNVKPRQVPDKYPAKLRISDLVSADITRLENNKYRFRYNIARKKDVPEMDAIIERYPALRDWNLKPPGAPAYADVVGEAEYILGEIRNRIDFVGDIKLEVRAEIIRGAASLMLNVDRSGQGYEFRLTAKGRARIIKRSLKDNNVILGDALTDFTQLEKNKINERGVYNIAFMREGNKLTGVVDGAVVSTVTLPEEKVEVEMDVRENGNISLRSPIGRCLWNNITITGEPTTTWIQDRYERAHVLVPSDTYEPSESWLNARDLEDKLSNAKMSFSRDFDEDWFAVSVEANTQITVRTSGYKLGITPKAQLYAPDGKTIIPYDSKNETDFEHTWVFTVKSQKCIVYLQISEAEGRRGFYVLDVTQQKLP